MNLCIKKQKTFIENLVIIVAIIPFLKYNNSIYYKNNNSATSSSYWRRGTATTYTQSAGSASGVAGTGTNYKYRPVTRFIGTATTGAINDDTNTYTTLNEAINACVAKGAGTYTLTVCGDVNINGTATMNTAGVTINVVSSDARTQRTITRSANTGYINTSDSDELPDWEYYPGTSAINTEDHMTSVDGNTYPTQIEFGDIQSSAAVHLYKYATELTEDAAGTVLADSHQFFEHPDGYFLLGFDDEANEGDYLATYPADSVIAITRDEDRTI